MSLKIGQTDSSRCVIISLDDRRKWIKSDNDPLPSNISVRNKVEAVLNTLWLYTAHQIANEFLRLAWSKHQKLNLLHLTKLVYLAHGWSLWLYGIPLLRDPIQTYEYGVLIPSLYVEKNCTDLSHSIGGEKYIQMLHLILKVGMSSGKYLKYMAIKIVITCGGTQITRILLGLFYGRDTEFQWLYQMRWFVCISKN
jgi:uncharacterized phage-associated protein